jgi:hypothetical protein
MHNDKDKERRIRHSTIEKRRRKKMSECLDALKHLVPNTRNQIRIHQLDILENAVEYIKQLKNEIGLSDGQMYVNNDYASDDPMDVFNIINS